MSKVSTYQPMEGEFIHVDAGNNALWGVNPWYETYQRLGLGGADGFVGTSWE